MSSGQQIPNSDDLSIKNMNIGGDDDGVRREQIVFKVYATLFVMLASTIAMALFFCRQGRDSSAQ